MKKKYLEAGKIVGTHGIRGELRVQSWCDSPEILCGLKRLYGKNGETEYPVQSARVHKTLVLLTLREVDSVEKADRLRGRILYLDREDLKLPEGAYFIQDLIGLRVTDADNGRDYGTLTDVLRTGANDVYEITAEDGKKTLIPSIPDVILKRDPEAGTMHIRPLKGLFENED